MKPLTNVALLFLIVWVAFLVGFAFVWQIYGSEHLVALGLGGFAIFLVAYTSVGVSIRKNPNGAWLQPVSANTGRVITNVVVTLWLCVVAGLLIFILSHLEKTRALIVLALFLAGGIGLGKLIKSKMSSGTLLPYGISFLVALIAAVLFAKG